MICREPERLTADACYPQWFEDLQRHVHGVTGNSDWTCCIGQGSQELIHRAFQVFVDPGEDNSVLIQT